MRTIYKRYKERLIEISGRSRSLYLRSIIKKYSYDMGAILEHCSDDEFPDFLWGKLRLFSLMNDRIAKKICKCNSTIAAEPEKLLNRQIESLKYLKREVDEMEKETGRYELFIGYPFVFGCLNSETVIKAPLILFPCLMEINKNSVQLNLSPNHPITFNKSLILAYAKEYGIPTDSLTQEFETLSETFSSPYDAIDYLNANGFKIKYTKRKGYLPFDDSKEDIPEDLEFRNMAVLGRFPTANAIYNDYLALEKEELSTPAIDLLLKGKETAKRTSRKNKDLNIYAIHELDYTQEKAIEAINTNDNLVVYGPPGTGKSQTIVNIISDALSKNQRILVVSQKRAALDVVFSRLGKLNTKAMLLPDPEKDTPYFFDRIKLMHSQTVNCAADTKKRYQTNERNIQLELETLREINDMLFTPREFGLNLQEMYAQSYNIGKDGKDYIFYKNLSGTKILNRNYRELFDDLKLIKDKNLAKLYLDKIRSEKTNPMISHIVTDLEMHNLKETKTFLTNLLENKITPFDASKYRYSRYVTTFYLEESASRKSLESVAEIITRINHPVLSKWLSISSFPLFWPIYPLLRRKYSSICKDINIDLNIALHALTEFAKQYAILSNVLDREGYALAVGGLINGNTEMLENLLKALEDYVTVRDLNTAFDNLPESVAELLDCAYSFSDKTLESFSLILEKILPVRIYHEIIQHDAEIESVLSKTVTFDSLRERILKLKADQTELAKEFATGRFSIEYLEYFNRENNAKDYLYQIQKQRALWPIRRMLEYFSGYLFRLFPCWLLSPQAVSTILPLERDLFDLVVFDEASQIFIEAALPSIYRAKRVVISGDNKQLRPTAGFIKRFLENDSFDYNMDLSMQAALEVESLLDLATAKFPSVNLSYHYRSESAELIDFSNMAFYENKLQIAPNVIKDSVKPPIERIKVKGIWQDRKNHEEAATVVRLVKNMFNTRHNAETIGIVTFNIEQKEYIEDLLDNECEKSSLFRRQYNAEQSRIICGENAGIFVKNLENVQGDERDIIIFSIGYAKNCHDKVIAQFGSLSMEGGENRLNVAITRARKKIYVVTSIDPEELNRIDTTKNNGPKLLKKYLQYARAISENSIQEVRNILSSFETTPKRYNETGAYEEQIKIELEKLGYKVDTNLGNTDYKLSLGIFDEKLKRYILGIECDYQAYKSSTNILERDIFRIKFLESRGWRIVRVWSRDWWQSRKKVLENLVSVIEEERAKYIRLPYKQYDACFNCEGDIEGSDIEIKTSAD